MHYSTIYRLLDDSPETRGVFLYMSKAYDKICHEDLLFKLKQNGISGNFLIVITDFLYQRKQSLVLNGRYLSWTNIEAGVPLGSIVGPVFFLIYISNLSDGLTSNPKLFADETSLIFIVHNINSTASNLKSDLMKICNRVFQWKIRFNPDSNKQAQEVIFNKKINKIDHLPLNVNQNLVKSSSTHKHLVTVLDTKLALNLHLKNVQNKVNKTIGFRRKLQSTLPRTSLIPFSNHL